MCQEKVSILMTIYNGENHIENTINSLLNQTYKNIEIVIVNDGSTDSSRDIVKMLSKTDERIIFIDRYENKGRVFSLNEGLSHCTSNFIFINDADDISNCNRIEECMSFYRYKITNKHSFGALGTASRTVDKKNNQIVDNRIFFGNIMKRRIPTWRMYIGMPFIHSSVMYSREALLNNGGFATEVTSLIDLFTLIKISKEYCIYGIDMVLVDRVIDGNNYFLQDKILMERNKNVEIIKEWKNKNIKYSRFYNCIEKIRDFIRL